MCCCGCCCCEGGGSAANFEEEADALAVSSPPPFAAATVAAAAAVEGEEDGDRDRAFSFPPPVKEELPKPNQCSSPQAAGIAAGIGRRGGGSKGPHLNL